MGDYVNGHIFNAQVQKDIHNPPPNRGHFCFRPPHPSPPPKFPFQGVLVIPPTLWNFRNFSTWFGTRWKEIFFVKNFVALYYYAKDKFFCNQINNLQNVLSDY